MQFIATLTSLILSVAVGATPAALAEPIRLDSGISTIEATPGPSAPAAIARRHVNVCSGSWFCSNSPILQGEIANAVGLIHQNNTYTTGGDKSGVCSANIGLFVQGKDAKKEPCTATGADLSNAASKIQGNGCEVCGWVPTAQGGDCVIKIDYVSGCGT